MYAIAFDLVVSDLKNHYLGSYNNAYYDVKCLLKKHGFQWTQGSVYLSLENDLTKVYLAINELSKIDWFQNSLRDIRVFRVEDWSDFTAVVKGNK